MNHLGFSKHTFYDDKIIVEKLLVTSRHNYTTTILKHDTLSFYERN